MKSLEIQEGLQRITWQAARRIRVSQALETAQSCPFSVVGEVRDTNVILELSLIHIIQAGQAFSGQHCRPLPQARVRPPRAS